jgi:NADPH:quinone reductase-like Zn-dependent oxidoreductase
VRVVVSAELGAGPSLAEIEEPVAGPGEVRVEVHGSSLNGFDNAVVAGWIAGFMELRFPVVLGRDFAGVIDQVGPDVAEFRPGDQVFGVVFTMPLQAGGFGEKVVVPVTSLARVPSGLDLATAGVLGLAPSAATTVMDTIAVQPGETVLISGATGGVGNMLIQLAGAAGATVLATAAPGAETKLVQRLGAAHTIDYTADVAAQVRDLAPQGVDAALHLAGDPNALADLVRPGGRLASLLGIMPEQLGDRDIAIHSVVATREPAALEKIAAQVAAGEIIVPVQRSYRLDEVPQAFADFAAGTMGKLAVSIS